MLFRPRRRSLWLRRFGDTERSLTADTHRLTQIEVSVFIKKTDMSGNFLHGELTYTILNTAFEVHNYLGCGFVEKAYYNVLIRELRIRKIIYENQKAIQILYIDVDSGNPEDLCSSVCICGSKSSVLMFLFEKFLVSLCESSV